MSDLRSKVSNALERLKTGALLTSEDFSLLIPLVEKFASELVREAGVRFQHVVGGYVIGNTLVPEILGLKYIHNLLQNGSVSCLELTAGPLLPPGAVSAEGKEAAAVATVTYDDDYMENIDDIPPNIATANSVFGAYDPLIDGKYMRAVRYRIDELEESGQEPAELQFLQNIVDNDMYRGKSKSHANEKEKARVSVQKAIKRAINKLIENPDTQDIGLYLRDHITFGNTCRYAGSWDFIF